MADPFLEWLGERIGYALAAMVLGPPAALKKRQRRELRKALREYCEDLEAIELATANGVLQRVVTSTTSAEPIALRIELDSWTSQATIETEVQVLPSYVDVLVWRSPGALRQEKLRLAEPLALRDGVRVDSTTLDVGTANALLDVLATTPLVAKSRSPFELELRSGHLSLRVMAPQAPAEWARLAETIDAVVAWLAKKWPTSYRT